VGYPSDKVNRRYLNVYLERAIPSNVEQAIMHPNSSLRSLAFDAFAGLLCERVSEIPGSMRVEYWRRC